MKRVIRVVLIFIAISVTCAGIFTLYPGGGFEENPWYVLPLLLGGVLLFIIAVPLGFKERSRQWQLEDDQARRERDKVWKREHPEHGIAS